MDRSLKKALFIHYDLPAQFEHLINAFSSEYEIYGICQRSRSSQSLSSRLSLSKLFSYQSRSPGIHVHPYLWDAERAVLNGQSVAQLLSVCKEQGIMFDIAIAHTGWGESLYFKDIYPDTPLIGYVEYFFNAKGSDADFATDNAMTLSDVMRIRTLNAQLLLGMSSCDALVTPTRWQKSLFPRGYQSAIEVIHEGVDIERVKPDPTIDFTLPNGSVLTRQDEVVTYTARNLEPYRGFPTLIKAVELICRRRPNCHVIITGGDEVSYSKRLPDGRTYRQELLKTVDVPAGRVHFLGHVPYATHLQILQLSSAHIYLTYPFVLSWSFIEAMASGCVMIVSDTPPVLEVLQCGRNGLTVNFFDFEAIADRVDQIFADTQRLCHLGEAARQTVVNHYQHHHGISRYRRLFQRLLKSETHLSHA